MNRASSERRAARRWRRMPLAARCALLACAFASNAWAHEGHGHLSAHEVLKLWSFDEPVTLALLAASALLYAVGSARIWKSLNKWRVVAFAAGWLALAIALVSPLDALSEILFSAHM